MGAIERCVSDPCSVDEGWALAELESGSLLRAVPELSASPADGNALPGDSFDLDEGWCLAEGTEERELSSLKPPAAAAEEPGSLVQEPNQPLLPSSFSPAPLESDAVLGPEEQAEFSQPDLALGTDVDLPHPSEHWFASLRPLVPPAPTARRETTSPLEPQAQIQSFSDSEHAFFAEGEELSREALAAPAPELEPEQRPRWWQRFRRAR